MRKKSLLLVTLLGCLFIFSHQSVQAMPHKHVDKTAILLVSFGTSYKVAQKSMTDIDRMVKKEFPGIEVHWAFTSVIIRRELAKRGQMIDAPAEAMGKMAAEGVTRLAVQSLHCIPGIEYNDLKRTVLQFRHIPMCFDKITLGRPLMYYHADIEKLVSALEQNVFPKNMDKHEAVVMMGHGTTSPANVFYAGIQYDFWKASPRYIVGTVEGYPTLEDVEYQLKKNKVKEVWLMPLMSVAGDHARNDMSGTSHSWQAKLEALGYQVHPVLKGMGEYPVIAQLWINHLKEAVNELQK